VLLVAFPQRRRPEEEDLGTSADGPDWTAELPAQPDAPEEEAALEDAVDNDLTDGPDLADEFSAWDIGREEFAAWGPASEHPQEADPAEGSSPAGGGDEEPEHALWRPRRIQEPEQATLGGPAYRAVIFEPEGWTAGTGHPQADEELPEEPAAPRGIADLLVQDEHTWGSVPGGTTDEVG
jgi:hypothetical protein